MKLLASVPAQLWLLWVFGELATFFIDSDSGLKYTGQISPFYKDPQLDSNADQSLRTIIFDVGPTAVYNPYHPQHLWARDTHQ